MTAVCLALICLAAVATPAAPTGLTVAWASFHQVALAWEDDAEASAWRVWRNGELAAETTQDSFFEDGLAAGMEWSYSVAAVDAAGVSGEAAQITVRTLDAPPVEGQGSAMSVADGWDGDLEDLSDADTFLSSICSDMASLCGGSAEFTAQERSAVMAFLGDELEFLSTPEPEGTEDAGALWTSLMELADTHFGGHSPAEIYFYGALTRLAGEFWAAGCDEAAKRVQSAARGWLPASEDACFAAMADACRFARGREPYSALSRQEAALRVRLVAELALAFLEDFPDASPVHVRLALGLALGEYRKAFPWVLSHDGLYVSFWEEARQFQERLWNSDEASHPDLVGAWQLLEIPVTLERADGLPGMAQVTVYDMTETAAPAAPRLVNLEGTAMISFFAGHVYHLEFQIPMTSGAPLRWALGEYHPSLTGKLVCQANGAQPTVLPDGPGIELVLPALNFPYNLSARKAPGQFLLAWEWPDTAGIPAGFAVLRDGVAVAQYAGDVRQAVLTLDGSGSHQYSVVAFDEQGVRMPASAPLAVDPGEAGGIDGYFDWLYGWFGTTAVSALDDYDGDGVPNYQEYLEGTNPTLPPCDLVVRQLRRGHGRQLVGWDAQESSAEVVYQLSRNGQVIAETTDTQFLDAGMVAGVGASYRVRVKDESDWGPAAELPTLRLNGLANHELIGQIVDAVGWNELGATTGDAIWTATCALAERLLETELSFASWFSEIVTSEIQAELEEQPGETAEPEAENDGGLSGSAFEQAYMFHLLDRVAERLLLRYRSADGGEPEALESAVQLYHLSLPMVAGNKALLLEALFNIARCHLTMLDDDASPEEIAELCRSIAEEVLVYYEHYPEDRGRQNLEDGQMSPVQLAVRQYWHNFPRMMFDGDYRHSFYNSALQLLLLDNWTRSPGRFEPGWVTAWRPETLYVTVSDGYGTLRLTDITSGLSQPGGWSALNTMREFDLTSGEPLAIPVLAGHRYRLEFLSEVPDAEPCRLVIPELSVEGGGRWLLAADGGLAALPPSASDGTEVTVDLTVQPAPYNLSASPVDGDGVFSLSWEWNTAWGVPEAFLVSRGGVQIAEVSGNIRNTGGLSACAGWEDDTAWTVQAVDDAHNALGVVSQAVSVLPPPSAENHAWHAWRLAFFGDIPVGREDDADQDGASNFDEFLAGSDPLAVPLAPSSEPGGNLAPGALVCFYHWTDTVLPEKFEELACRYSEIRSDFLFGSTANPLECNLDDGFAMKAEGLFLVTESGRHSFHLCNADGAAFYIDGALVLEHDRNDSPQELTAVRRLAAGWHSFRLEYRNQDGDGRLQLDWAGPSFGRRSFDSQGIWHLLPSSTSRNAEENIAWRRDTDGDGLGDLEEIQAGTAFDRKDTDGDGLDDYAELHLHGTNPLLQDTNGDQLGDAATVFYGLEPGMLSFSPEELLDGSDFQGVNGVWRVEGGQLACLSRRGSAGTGFTLAEASVCRLALAVQLFGQAPVAEVPIDLWVDGRFVGTENLAVGQDAVQVKQFHTSWLAAGEHSLVLRFDNCHPGMTLVISTLEVATAEAGANNAVAAEINGAILQSRNQASAVNASKVSPYCMTGEALFPELVEVVGCDARPFGERQWFANVPLSEQAPVQIDIQFENGGYVVQREVSWIPTNCLDEDGTVLLLRAGDSLRLTASPAGASGGSWQISGLPGEVVLNGLTGECLSFQFDEPGHYDLTATFIEGALELQGGLTVEVFEYSFTRPVVADWLNWPRQYREAAPSGPVRFRFDNRMVFAGETDGLFQVVSDDNQPRWIAALLGTDGPVLACQEVIGMDIQGGAMTVLEEGEDLGTARVWELPYVCSDPRDDVELRLQIFVPGVVFEDGSVLKTLTAQDFDETGVAHVRFVRNNDVQTSVCHNLRAYQNGEHMGYRSR